MCNVIFFHLLFKNNKIHCFSKKSFHSHLKIAYIMTITAPPPSYRQCFFSAAMYASAYLDFVTPFRIT